MKKKIQVVLLPTNQKANSHLFKNPNSDTLMVSEGIGNLALYFLSDDAIKHGDWFYSVKVNRILQAVGDLWKYGYDKSLKKKVIACTDKSLKREIDGNRGNLLPDVSFDIHLPQPPQDFVQLYIQQYNAGNVIEWVEVEFEGFECSNGHYMAFQTTCSYPHCQQYNQPKLKVNLKNNTIVVSPVKDLQYWKANAEEDYIKTPISVLRYISELEKAILS